MYHRDHSNRCVCDQQIDEIKFYSFATPHSIFNIGNKITIKINIMKGPPLQGGGKVKKTMNNTKRAIMVMEQYRRVARIAGDEKSVSEITYLIDNVDHFETAVNELCMKGFINNTTAKVINHVDVYLGGHKYV